MNLLKRIYRFFVPHPVRVGQVWELNYAGLDPFKVGRIRATVLDVDRGYVQFRQQWHDYAEVYSTRIRKFRLTRSLISEPQGSQQETNTP